MATYRKPYTIDLKAQMAVCDANFIRILKLLPVLDQYTKRIIAMPVIDSSEQSLIELEVVEIFKYTSTIKLTQKLSQKLSQKAKNSPDSFDQKSDHYASPEIIVRMYHDASTAEVISYQNHRHFKAIYAVPNEKMYQSDEKEQLNLLLSEWLKLCLEEGLYYDSVLEEKLAMHM